MLKASFAVVLFALAVGSTITAGVEALDRWDVAKPSVGVGVMSFMRSQIEALAAGEAGAHRVAFLGDSVSISTQGRLPSVPKALRAELAKRPAPTELHALAALGMGPFEYCFIVDEIIAARPDQVVLAFSLNAFGESRRNLSRSRLSGWTPPSRVLELAGLPLDWIGLTFDDLLMNVLIVRAGGFDAWRSLLSAQARVGTARAEFASWLGLAIGSRGPQAFRLAQTVARRRVFIPGKERYTAVGEQNHYGPILDVLDGRHPVLQVLAATLQSFRDAGIPTVVYVNPINVDHLGSVDVLDATALSRNLDVLAEVVRESGAEFEDLHDLVPDEGFRDAAGHFGPAEGVAATERIAAAIVPRIGPARSTD